MVYQEYYILSTRKHENFQITSLKNTIYTEPEKCYSLRLKVWLPLYRNCCEQSCHSHTKCFRLKDIYEGYRIVFASICQHASNAFIFASASSDQFLLRAASTL